MSGETKRDIDRLQQSWEQRRIKRWGPTAIGQWMNRFVSQRGLANRLGRNELAEAWREIVGTPWYQHTRMGAVRNGTLEITVANSMVTQELTFQQDAILAQLNARLPETPIKRLSFRVGKIDS